MKKHALHVNDWPYDKLIETFLSLADEPYTLFFDSARPSHPLSKWSFIVWDPVETIECKNGQITYDNQEIHETDLFSFLQTRLENYDFDSTDLTSPFSGGLAGYFGYDLGRQLETIPNNTDDDLNLPDCALGIYTNVVAFDHQNKKGYLIHKEGSKSPELKESTPYFLSETINWQNKTSDTEYKSNIQNIIDNIHAGEIYQANISRRFDTDLPKNFSPKEHYAHLRSINSAPFSAFMNFGSFQLASTSPERFLTTYGNTVETRPIKGTLPAYKNPDDLQRSKKDRAENLMIVDLLRNDISKNCKPHSVKVPSLCNIETFAGVHHLVSTVTGELQKNKTSIDLLRDCFPGGSITGAPKIRAMEIIEELEPTRRGPYCGAMGYIGFNGNMDTNIIIRTIVYKDGKAHLQTGSGIVSDSNPEAELQEGLDKAQKIFESFEPPEEENAA
ncbi:MAG: aminodeoxychorismate synthase component I [Alphaproteobacteria bacterium]|nr:aminodeoxychorismate synthase component I [Alphaproteobacteria bacterium]